MKEEPNTLLETEKPIETWAYIELFGHSRIAGRVSERKLGAVVMIQVDVPQGETEFSHSRVFNTSAIFSINPTTEAWCRRFAKTQTSHDLLPYVPMDTTPASRQIDYSDSETDPNAED